MDYYRCSKTSLLQELSRRGLVPAGGPDQWSEMLEEDDKARGSDATSIELIQFDIFPFPPAPANPAKVNEFGTNTPPNQLVGELIVHWTLNTFFPTLQLFFASGRSCTIDGSSHNLSLPACKVGLDEELRYRLTDISHEEDGCLFGSSLPAKFVGSMPGLRILQAGLARRKSVAVIECTGDREAPFGWAGETEIVSEVHDVVGLRLEGMKDWGFVWTRRTERVVPWGERAWGNVRVAAVRDDVAAPSLGGVPPEGDSRGETRIVTTGSMINSSKSGLGRI